MAIKTKDGMYKCSYCGKIFTHPQEADQCREDHKLIFIQITKEDFV